MRTPPRDLLHRVNEQVGCGLMLVGHADLGETAGAAYVRWPDGRRSVLTRSTVSASRMRQTADVLSAARARGLPVPQHELVVELDDGVVAAVQERLPGRPPRFVDTAVVDAVVAVNDRFAGVLTGRPDVPVPSLASCRRGGRAERSSAVEQHSDRSRCLLRRIRDVRARHPEEMTGDDLVHTDLTTPNVLFDDAGRVTGVVDWNGGAARGDRRFALVKLLFDLVWDAAAPGGPDRVHHDVPGALEALLHERLEPGLLQRYWAHWTLVMLDWTIRCGDRDAVDLHLRLGERGLDRIL